VRARALAIACAVVALALLAGRQPAFAAEAAGQPAPPPRNGQTAPDARHDLRQDLPPVSPERATRIADRTPEVREQRGRHPNLTARDVILFGGSGDWGIRYQDGSDPTKLAEVTVDGHTGEVIEAWQGIQADWVMARGHDGYFGERFESWYIWLPLCALFLFPFFDPRRPFRMLHLDLLVLVAGFGISHFFFNQGEIGTSVPIVYPVLAYFLARMLVAAFRPRRSAGPLVPIVPAVFLVVGIVLLGGLRIGLDVTSGRVGDVGYGSAVGAYRIQHDEPLYVDSGRNDLHFDTYGPVNYLAYDPFVRVLEPTEQQLQGSSNYELPAARVAALVFDVLTLIGLFLLGLRLRSGRAGRMLGLALAYGWVSFPYTLFPLMTNGNDTLIAMFLVYALLALTSTPARGALIALAGAAKFAPLALAPLFAAGPRAGLLSRDPETGDGPFARRRLRALALFALALLGVGALAMLQALLDPGLSTFSDRTVDQQVSRESPFSIWGQEPSLEWLRTALMIATVGLALLVAFVPRRRTVPRIAALAAAILIALQITAEHWFYLYIVWFFPLLVVALAGDSGPAGRGVSSAHERDREQELLTVP
jgi:hypothetical protein